MAPATSDLLPRRRYRSVLELSWDESVCVETPRGAVEVRAIQVKHWGARLGSDTHRGYNGYVIRREGRALLFGGDTAYTPRFASHRRHGPFDAAIMPIGAYDPFIQPLHARAGRRDGRCGRRAVVRAGPSPNVSVEPRAVR